MSEGGTAGTIAFALGSSASVGVADFLGGAVSRRRHPVAVTLTAQTTNLLLVVPLALVWGWDRVTVGAMALGVVVGVAVAGSYTLFFRALSGGRMGVVAPVTALTGAVVPVGWGVVTGDALSGLDAAGIALALVAVPLVSWTPGSGAPARPAGLSTAAMVVLAVGAGLGFATFFVYLGEVGGDPGLWPLAAVRVGSVATMAVAALRLERAELRPDRVAAMSGAFELLASVLIRLALQWGPVSVAAVLGSLYPLATIALARRVLGEHVHRLQLTGAALAVLAVALLAA
jgi:drug/metabolite transporter (DMT)-like permease